ncbi:MAG: two-component sensor histidine kinase [Vicingaceae bacterium]|jgi:two-component sensor histidine kinase
MISVLRFFFRFCLAFVLGFPSIVTAQSSLPSIDFQKIEEERNLVNYSLDQIVTIIETSLIANKQVTIPENVTEFERALFQARSTQNQKDQRNQLEAIKQLNTLLEFKCYRTKGEELYIRLLLGTSISYMGTPLIAHNYIKPVFPDIFKEIDNPKISNSLINSYAGLLIRIDSLELAEKVYKDNLSRYEKNDEIYEVYNTLNSLGFIYIKLGKYDNARAIFIHNQNKKYASLNPVIHAFSFGNYGTLLSAEGDYDSALFYMRKEIKIMNAIPSDEGLENTYFGIGKIFEVQNEIDSAKKYYHLTLEASEKKKNLPLLITAYEKLINISVVNEKTTELSNLLESYLYYSDSLKTSQKINAVEKELQVSQLLEIFKTTEDSKKRYDLLKNKTNSLVYTVVGLTIIILLMALTISVYFQNRNRLKSNNLELEEKNNELKKSHQLTSDSNERNRILLKELHHRVKNNLQIISSLFNLQLNASGMEVETEQVFKDAKNRIYSISLVHKKIYQSNNIDSLDFGEYLRDFSDELFNATLNDVNLSIEILRNPISIESAIPLGLIFNELFTNSIQHARRHDSLQIKVLYKELNGKEKFIYTDNGVGVQNTELMKESDSSIGVTLIHLLGKQLDAKIEYKEAKDGEHGFWLSIEGNFS